MPGPQFNQNKNSSWFNRHSQKLVLGIIVVLIAVGAFSFYKSYQNRKTLLETALQNVSPSPVLVSPTPSGAPSVKISATPALKIPKETATGSPKPQIIEKRPAEVLSGAPSRVLSSFIPEVNAENGQFTVKAAQGNGATHLARYALKEYLKDKELKNELGAEQKIFIEDYLRKHVVYPPTLHPGNQLVFSENLIKEAIQKAQALSPAQIQNLSQYVPLVPSI